MKVVLVAAISSDGFIARHKDELADWTTSEDKKFFVKITKELGTMVMGRTTFETIGRALPGRRMIVLTSKPEEYHVDGVEFTNETPKELIWRLEDEGVEGLAVCGGAKVYTDYLSEGVIDQVVLTQVDVMLESGIPLINKKLDVNLKQVSSQRLSDVASVHVFLVKKDVE